MTAPVSRGALDLGSKGALSRGGQARIAAELGVDPGVVSRWVSSERKPNARFRGLLEKKYGIPRAWWDEPVSDEATTDDGDAAA